MEDIQTLILELEREQAELKRLIDEAVEDGEYLLAHHHSKAMAIVTRQIQTLKNLDDKNFDKRHFIQLRINKYLKDMELDGPQKIKDYLNKQLENLSQQLRDLDKQKNVTPAESSVLTHHIRALLSGNIRALKIHLRKSKKFTLDITRQHNGVMLQFQNVKSFGGSSIVSEENLYHFFGLGFTADENHNTLSLSLSNPDQDYILAELKIIISKIIFEVFYFKEFEGDTFIEVV